jgi:ATP-binding cassette, subfamily G (WHITE), member 2
MTIHQPSARIFDLLDKVTFLAKGSVTFFGDAQALQPFIVKVYQELSLGNMGYANPPELFLDLSDRLLAENKIESLTSKFDNGSSKAQVMTLPSTRGELENVPAEVQYANSFVGDVLVLMHRALINILRTKELFVARFGSAIFFGILTGTLFLYPKNDDAGIFHKASFFILTLAYFNWTSLEALPIFYQERETFEREYASGAYRAISYVVSSSLIYFPFLFALSFVYNVIAYWLLNLPNTGDRFLFQVFIVFVVLINASTFATTLSTLLPDPMTAQTIGSAIFAVMLVFSGFFITRDDIPDYWIYFHYLSFFKYGIDSQLVNGLQGYARTPTKTNEQVLEEFSVNGMSKWQGLGILIAWTLFYRSIFYYRLITAFNGSRKK